MATHLAMRLNGTHTFHMHNWHNDSAISISPGHNPASHLIASIAVDTDTLVLRQISCKFQGTYYNLWNNNCYTLGLEVARHFSSDVYQTLLLRSRWIRQSTAQSAITRLHNIGKNLIPLISMPNNGCYKHAIRMAFPSRA